MQHLDLLLIRHGEAEHNVTNRTWFREGILPPPEHYVIADKDMPLTEYGEQQARQLGHWLITHALDQADIYTASPYRRTQQTAHALDISSTWTQEPLLRERDWGLFMSTPHNKRELLLAAHGLDMATHDFDTPMPGGESMAQITKERAVPFIEKVSDEYAGQRVVAVSHGEMMEAIRYAIEGQSPDQWRQEKLTQRSLANTSVLHYKTTDGKLRRRMVVPHDPRRSWDNGKWVEL